MATRVKVKGLNKNMARIRRDVFNAAGKAMNDCMTDLVRVSSEAAPLDDGVLEMSGEKSVRAEGASIIGNVRYEAWNDHKNRSYDFNYAIWTHEEEYNLGKRSASKSSAKGMSGKSYPVGRQYLKAPFMGEVQYYRDTIEQQVKAVLKG